jgi:hypothetical protein
MDTAATDRSAVSRSGDLMRPSHAAKARVDRCRECSCVPAQQPEGWPGQAEPQRLPRAHRLRSTASKIRWPTLGRRCQPTRPRQPADAAEARGHLARLTAAANGRGRDGQPCDRSTWRTRVADSCGGLAWRATRAVHAAHSRGRSAQPTGLGSGGLTAWRTRAVSQRRQSTRSYPHGRPTRPTGGQPQTAKSKANRTRQSKAARPKPPPSPPRPGPPPDPSAQRATRTRTEDQTGWGKELTIAK